MKIWHRSRKMDLGKTLLVWHHRAVSRFFMKIATWLLGGFVCGMLTSIFFAAIGSYEIAQGAARIVFIVVFIAGVAGSYLRNVHYGLEYRIMERGLGNVKPLLGTHAAGHIIGLSDDALGGRTEYILWSEIREVKEEEGTLIAILKNDQRILLGIAPVVSLSSTSDGGGTRVAHGGKYKPFSRDEKLDRDATRLIVQKAREARKSAASSPK
jgi:hypothetical protein